MKRMITQELIDKIIALFGNIDIGSGQITIHKLHLQDVKDLLVSDLGALFPTPSDDKLLAWDGGVIKNVDFPVSFTHSFAELDETLQTIINEAFTDAGNNGVSCSEAQWGVIKALLDKSLYLNFSGYSVVKVSTNGLDNYLFGSSASAVVFAGVYRIEINYDFENNLIFMMSGEA